MADCLVSYCLCVAYCRRATVGEQLSSDLLSWWLIVLVGICRVTDFRSEILSLDKIDQSSGKLLSQ